MAIVSITEKNYKTVKSTDKSFEYDVEYIVVTDSSTGPEDIKRDPLFQIGRQYTFGVDSNPNAKLKSVSIDRMSDDSRTHWIVKCNYSSETRAGKPGGGGGGGGGDDPFKPPKETRPTASNQRDETFEIRFTSVSEPMYYGRWLGTGQLQVDGETCCPWKDDGFDGPSPKYPRAAGGTGVYAVCNSAGQPIDPPLSTNVVRPVFRYVLEYPAASSFYQKVLAIAGKVNSDPIKIIDLDGTEIITANPGTLRCTVSNVEPLPSWEAFAWVNFEFEYEACGHGQLVPDKGRMFFIKGEDVISEGVDGGVRADIVKIDGVEVARDEMGDPIEEEVWLDGRGKKNTSDRNYFMKWVPASCYYTTFSDKYPFNRLEAKG